MRLWTAVRMWMRARLRPDAVQSEIDGELAYHLEMRTQDFIAAGSAPAEARRRARAAFGDFERTRRECHRLQMIEPTPGGDGVMTELMRDLRYSLRSVRRNPGFAAVVILTLGLGIGANTAIFSVVDGVLLQPLPFPDGDRLVDLAQNDRLRGTTSEGFSAPDFFDVVERNRSFTALAAWSRPRLTLTAADNEPQRVIVATTSHTLFDIVGVKAVRGRVYDENDDQPGGPRVAVLGNGIWANRFGADPDVLGRTVTLDGNPYEVIGVMPAGFDFPLGNTEMWIPLQISPTASPPRGNHGYGVTARLAEGVSLERANADLAAIAADLEVEYPNDNLGRGMWAQSQIDATVGSVRSALFLLLGAVGLVLLVACVNVANLLLARATVREREVAVRTALGARRGRLLRQFLTDSLVLGALGGAAGIVFAVAGVRALIALGPASLPRVANVGIDLRILGFAAAASLATGVLFGLLPAIHASKPDLQSPLREGGRTRAGSGRGGARQALVVTEVALAVVLVIGAGLLMQSFLRLQRVDPGFEAENLLTATVQLPAARYPQTFSDFPNWPEVQRFHRDVVERVRALPGVQGVAVALNHPMAPGWTTRFVIDGKPPVAAGEQEEARVRPVTPGYFRLMGIPILAGRALADTDRADQPPVLVINEAFARRYFPDENPIGERLTIWGQSREIVGVAANVKYMGLNQPTWPGWYTPLEQMPFSAFSILVRTTGDPLDLVPSLRSEVAGMDNSLAIFGVGSMESILESSVAQPRFNMMLLVTFAVVAMTLAAIGIYGVISYGVAQRAHEIGVRISLGAKAGDVVRQIVTQGLRLAGLGVALGLVGSLALAQTMSSLLFGVGAMHLPTFGMVGLIVVVVSGVATLVPARRASRVDPIVALRGD